MTAVSAMVLVLLGTALVVAVAAVLVATGRVGEGISLPARTPGGLAGSPPSCLRPPPTTPATTQGRGPEIMATVPGLSGVPTRGPAGDRDTTKEARMAAMKPRTGDGPLEVVEEGRSIIMRVPLEGGGRLVVEIAASEAVSLRDALQGVIKE